MPMPPAPPPAPFATTGLTKVSRKRPRAMILVPGKGAFSGAVDVYRAPDGVGIVVIGAGTAVRQTPHGPVRVSGNVQVEFPSDAAFDHAKNMAFLKNPKAYAAAVGMLGIDDDARHAPPLPPAIAFHGAAAYGHLLPSANGDVPMESLVEVGAVVATVDGASVSATLAPTPATLAPTPTPMPRRMTAGDLFGDDDESDGAQ